MKKKDWTIGEYCVGGIITTKITGTDVLIETKDWNGNRSARDKAMATVMHSATYNVGDTQGIMDYLYEQTTSFWIDKILEWIASEK